MASNGNNQTIAVVAGVGLLGSVAAIWAMKHRKKMDQGPGGPGGPGGPVMPTQRCSKLEPGMTEALAYQKYYSTNYLEYVRQAYLVDLGARGFTGQLCGDTADAIYQEYLRLVAIVNATPTRLSFVTAGPAKR